MTVSSFFGEFHMETSDIVLAILLGVTLPGQVDKWTKKITNNCTQEDRQSQVILSLLASLLTKMLIVFFLSRVALNWQWHAYALGFFMVSALAISVYQYNRVEIYLEPQGGTGWQRVMLWHVITDLDQVALMLVGAVITAKGVELNTEMNISVYQTSLGLSAGMFTLCTIVRMCSVFFLQKDEVTKVRKSISPWTVTLVVALCTALAFYKKDSLCVSIALGVVVPVTLSLGSKGWITARLATTRELLMTALAMVRSALAWVLPTPQVVATVVSVAGVAGVLFLVFRYGLPYPLYLPVTALLLLSFTGAGRRVLGKLSWEGVLTFCYWGVLAFGGAWAFSSVYRDAVIGVSKFLIGGAPPPVKQMLDGWEVSFFCGVAEVATYVVIAMLTNFDMFRGKEEHPLLTWWKARQEPKQPEV